MIETPSMNIYRQLFSDDEWNAIYDAMGDYQDYGEHEHDMMTSVRAKISALFIEK
jgi:hypothetical protein